MTVAAVTVDNLRVDDAQANTGWANWGGGGPAPAAEPSYPYNGTNAVNKLSNATSFEGLAYTPTNDGKSATDHSVTNRDVWMSKCQVADNGDLTTADGVQVACGSSATNIRIWDIAGTDAISAFLDTYSSVGGEGGAYLIVPIEVDITTYRIAAGDTGTPDFTAGDFYGVRAKFQNGNAKSENLAMAAIDFGSGLYLVSGTGADPVGGVLDLIDFDQGTSGNRYGYAYLLGGVVPAINGHTRIGTTDDSTHTETRFTLAEGSTVYVPNHLASAGWAQWHFWIGNALTSIVLDGTLESLGDTTDIDSRVDINTTSSGTPGTVTGKGSLVNCRNVVLTDDWTFTGRIECLDLTQAGATLNDSTLVFSSATSVAACDDQDFAKLERATIVQDGAGHAFEVAGTTTITLVEMVGLDASGGFGADTTNSAALHFTATSGTIIVNLTNMGTDPTYKTDGVIVSFVASYTLTLTGIASGVQTTIVNSSTRVELQNSTSTGVDITYTHSGGEIVDILFMANDYDPLGSDIYDLTLPSSDSSIPISIADERNYVNP